MICLTWAENEGYRCLVKHIKRLKGTVYLKMNLGAEKRKENGYRQEQKIINSLKIIKALKREYNNIFKKLHKNEKYTGYLDPVWCFVEFKFFKY